MKGWQDDVVVLGAGLAGLSAGHALARAGRTVRVLERDPVVGGLARTVERGPFRFDLGGHRLFTDDERIERWIRDLLGPECLDVQRRSRIHLRNRFIEYPLRPLDAMAGLGVRTVSRILLDHAAARLRGRFAPGEEVSLEDWVVARFGRALFDIYFKEYSEKVWGIRCDRISKDWVARRIQGLSLGKALRNAFFRTGRRTVRTLTDRFLYPARGIGTIAERLRLGIEGADERNEVRCSSDVVRLRHDGRRLGAASVRNGSTSDVEGRTFVSTLPLGSLVRMLDPRPPASVLGAASCLRFRDLVVVAVIVGRGRATDQSWIYFPERKFPFGRIHEPTNWSPAMAPPGRTVLVAELFCFRGDETWSAGDDELSHRTVAGMHDLGIVCCRDVLDTVVLRIPNAYPLFEVGYDRHRERVLAYLRGFENLFLAGRSGTFAYLNMDHAMAAGLEAAQRILASGDDAPGDEPSGVLREKRSA